MTEEVERATLEAYRGRGKLGGGRLCRIFEWEDRPGHRVRGNAAAFAAHLKISWSSVHEALRRAGFKVLDYPEERAARGLVTDYPSPEPYTEPATDPVVITEPHTGEHMASQERINLPRPMGHVRATRAPLYVRCYEAMQGALVTAAKGQPDFSMEELGANIDPRLRPTVWYRAVGTLATKGLLQLTTPPTQTTYRRWKIVDQARFNTVMTALAGEKPDTGNDTVRELVVASQGLPAAPKSEPSAEPKPGFWQRLFGGGQGRRLRRIEKQMEATNGRLRRIEQQLDELIKLWK